MEQITFKGRHAEICRTLASGNREGTLNQIYAYFRTGENSDTYSIQILTILRELIDDGESDELGRLRIRIRGCGDRILINLVQFVYALDEGNHHAEAKILADKCLEELPRLCRSMEDFCKEEEITKVYEMAGLRIRESIRLLREYYALYENEEAQEQCVTLSLVMTRLFLFAHDECFSADMLCMALMHKRRGEQTACENMCRELISRYGHVLSEIENSAEFNREKYEIVDCLKTAYCELDIAGPDHSYREELARIERLFSEF